MRTLFTQWVLSGKHGNEINQIPYIHWYILGCCDEYLKCKTSITTCKYVEQLPASSNTEHYAKNSSLARSMRTHSVEIVQITPANFHIERSD